MQAACSDMPATMNGRSPNRLMSAPAICGTMMVVAPHGISRSPASSGP
jgi:hypothetical protein